MPKLSSVLSVLFFALSLPASAQNLSKPQQTVTVALTAPATDPKAAWESDELLNADLLKVQLVVSRTAQVFHVVDQISLWSKTCHRQYLPYFGGADGSELSDEDRQMLQKHVAIREKHPWGQGLEQTFYATLSIAEAAREGVTAGRLTQEEADTEVEVLNHFATRVEPLVQRELPTLTKFRDQLKAERVSLAVFMRQLSRFCGNRRYKLSLYLIADPHDINHGSGVAGGRMVLEVPRNGEGFTTLVRGLTSAFIEQYPDDVNKAIAGVNDLTADTLTDAIEYALTPGIYRPQGADDVLLYRVARDLETKKPLTDPAARTQHFALMLRPALAAALADKSQTLPLFLPRAVDIWRSMNELQRAASTTVSQYRASKAPSIFIFGDFDNGLVDYFQNGTRHLFSRPHRVDAYQEIISNYAKAQDTVVLLATADTVGRIPSIYSDLLPLPLTKLRDRLNRGETVVMQGTARNFKVVLLAAPKQMLVDSLVRSNRNLWQ